MAWHYFWLSLTVFILVFGPQTHFQIYIIAQEIPKFIDRNVNIRAVSTAKIIRKVAMSGLVLWMKNDSSI